MRCTLSVAPLLLIVGCSSVLPGDTLSGTWGADDAEIRATANSFSLELACERAEFTRPAVLDDEGRFEIEGETTWSSWPSSVGAPVRVTGRIIGERMAVRIVLTNPYGDGSWTSSDTLVRGRRAEWKEGRVCVAAGGVRGAE